MAENNTKRLIETNPELFDYQDCQPGTPPYTPDEEGLPDYLKQALAAAKAKKPEAKPE